MKIGKEVYAMLENNKREVSVAEFMPISFDEDVVCCYNCGDESQKILFLPVEMFSEDIKDVDGNIVKMKESINEVRQGFDKIFVNQL